MTEDEAHLTVRALLEDVRHVMSSRPHNEWPEWARKVSDHHSPAVHESLLGWQDSQLQAAAMRILDGLIVSDVDAVRLAILDLRAVENLAAAPPPTAPTPPSRPSRPSPHAQGALPFGRSAMGRGQTPPPRRA